MSHVKTTFFENCSEVILLTLNMFLFTGNGSFTKNVNNLSWEVYENRVLYFFTWARNPILTPGNAVLN